ncbi:MAG: hypothetical protein V3T48_10100, partial [Vicinamibacterales bacterium]
MESGGATTRPGGIVQTPIYCRRCGYNLYALSADGPCPECGLAAWESILHTVDPAASRLPRIRNPGVVGDALLWLMILLATAAILLVVRPVATLFDAMDPSGVRSLAGWTPAWLSLVAGFAGLAALIWVRRLAPPAGEESSRGVWRDVRWLGFGLAAWSVLVIVAGMMQMQVVAASGWAVMAMWLAVAGVGVIPLLGLRGIFRTIGLRSREYRTASGGRQGIRAMVAATIGAAVGQIVRLLAAPTGIDELSQLGIVV